MRRSRRTITAQWHSYKVPRCANLNNILLRVTKLGQIIRKIKDTQGASKGMAMFQSFALSFDVLLQKLYFQLSWGLSAP